MSVGWNGSSCYPLTGLLTVIDPSNNHRHLFRQGRVTVLTGCGMGLLHLGQLGCAITLFAMYCALVSPAEKLAFDILQFMKVVLLFFVLVQGFLQPVLSIEDTLDYLEFAAISQCSQFTADVFSLLVQLQGF